MALTGRKKAFADAVLAGKTKTAAAIEAGLSAATAAAAGCRMAKDKAVQKYISESGWKMATAAATGRPTPAAAKVKDPKWPFGTGPTDPSPERGQDQPAEGAGKVYTARELLSMWANDPELEMKMRIDSAKALLPIEEGKAGAPGKKQKQAADARSASTGKYAPAAPPKLAAAGGKRV